MNLMRRIVRLLGRVFVDSPAGWVIIAAVTCFHHAQSSRIGWNAIELIIAQHLLDHRAYVTSLDYPSALPWRPVAPTALVTFLRWWIEDPRLILQCVCGLSVATLTGSLFEAARRLWGRLAAHVAAAACLLCPAVTFALIDHIHSISHFGALLFLGPTLLLSTLLLKHASEAPVPPGLTWYVATGIAWGLCYLSRSELLLYGALHLLMLTAVHVRRRLDWRPLAGYAAMFGLCFLTYNVLAARAAADGGLLIRKPIYGFYISQGWADPRPNAFADTEADGYVYAQTLYGAPSVNHEHLLTAIVRHPAPFLRRVRLNAKAFYGRFTSPDFYPASWLALAGAGIVLALLTGTTTDRRIVLFLAALFAASHFILIFHIDSRYLTIGAPPLLLLAVYAVHRGWQRVKRYRWGQATFFVVLLVGFAASSRNQLGRLVQHPAVDDHGVAAMRSFGYHFRTVVAAPRLGANREPHVDVMLPTGSTLPAEDTFLLPYFAHSAWIGIGAEGPFPRGRFYSFRDCPTDYRYVPRDVARADPRYRDHIVAEYDNPVLGAYALVSLN